MSISYRHGCKINSGLFDELIIDNFAGGGGASMGIEAAIGRSVDIAINHDRHSVETHSINHPHTRHLCEDVCAVDPTEATAGRPVGLAWFSPDCRHFSRAKGGKPVQKKIRGLAWIVVKWAKAVRPRVIILENVREFQDWGPLTADSRPCPDRKGLTFRRWKAQLQNLGYVVDHRVLNAADFGAPTHRRRFFFIARCDGQPITWPEPTHGPGRKPYRTAAQCIDWSLPCPSIFLTKEEAKSLKVIRPLADKTMRRIAMGLKRYVLDNPKPFIVTCNHSGPEFRGQSIDQPMSTLTAARDAHGVCMPYVAGVGGRAGQSPATAGDAPIGTITAKNDRAVVAPFIARCARGDTSANGQKRWGNGSQPATEPLPTMTASKDFAVAAPFLVEVQNGSSEVGHRSVDRPAHTVTANPKGGGMAVVGACLSPSSEVIGGECPNCGHDGWLNTDGTCRHCLKHIAPFFIANYGEAPHQATRGQAADEPIRTITPANNTGVIIAPLLGTMSHTGTTGREKYVDEVTEPLKTITGSNDKAVIAPVLIGTGGQDYSGKPKSTDEPIGTLMTDNRRSLVSAFLAKHYGDQGQRPGSTMDEPLGTVTAVDHHSVVASNLVHMNHGEKQWSAIDEPLRAITSGGNHAAEVRAFITKYYGNGDGQPATEPLHTVTSRDRMGVVTVQGHEYQIVDIGLRMLQPVELLRAQFGKYAKGYILTGTKSQQVAKIGNSVPPELAEAIVRANFTDAGEIAGVA